MMTPQSIASLIESLEAGSATDLEFEVGGAQLRLRRGSTRRPVSAPTGAHAAEGLGSPHDSRQDDAGGVTDILSPATGRFARLHPLAEPPNQDGDMVCSAGTLVGFLQIGPLLSGVGAPSKGTVVAQLVADGTIVGFGTPLLSFAPCR